MTEDELRAIFVRAKLEMSVGVALAVMTSAAGGLCALSEEEFEKYNQALGHLEVLRRTVIDHLPKKKRR